MASLLVKLFEPMTGPSSIVFANEEDWQMRQKCLYHTLEGTNLKSYFANFVSIIKETEAAWSSYTPSDKMGLEKAVNPLMLKGIALTCLGRLYNDEKELDKLSNLYHNIWKELQCRLIHGDPEEGSERLVMFEANKKLLMDIVQNFIGNCRREGSDVKENLPFINSMLMNYVSEETISSDIITFMLGGIHTTGYLMVWLLWALATNPDYQQRLLDEVREEVGGDCRDKLKEYTLRRDTFMRQVLDETLRLNTLATYSGRYSDEDESACGYQIPAGTPIIFALGMSMMDTTQWNKEDEWNPDRFLPTETHSRRGHKFCPFGIQGKRVCPGYHFAYFEVAIFVAVLIQRFEFVPVDGQDVVKVYGLVTLPKEEIYVHLHQRKKFV